MLTNSCNSDVRSEVEPWDLSAADTAPRAQIAASAPAVMIPRTERPHGHRLGTSGPALSTMTPDRLGRGDLIDRQAQQIIARRSIRSCTQIRRGPIDGIDIAALPSTSDVDAIGILFHVCDALRLGVPEIAFTILACKQVVGDGVESRHSARQFDGDNLKHDRVPLLSESDIESATSSIYRPADISSTIRVDIRFSWEASNRASVLFAAVER